MSQYSIAQLSSFHSAIFLKTINWIAWIPYIKPFKKWLFALHWEQSEPISAFLHFYLTTAIHLLKLLNLYWISLSYVLSHLEALWIFIAQYFPCYLTVLNCLPSLLNSKCFEFRDCFVQLVSLLLNIENIQNFVEWTMVRILVKNQND